MHASISPQSKYRERLLHEIAAFRPETVLEVGCGGGAFLRSAASLGVTVHGIDPDPESVRKLQSEGFSVATGTGEALPYPDAAWDLVVFSYTAHHVGNWSAALTEALRTCRLGVVVLDPWYDARIPSQSVALAFDRWCKSIDRSNGMVHNDCLDAAALLGSLAQNPGGLAIHIEYLLSLSELGVSCLQQAGSEHLAGARNIAQWTPELERIVQLAQVQGYSDDGAILLIVSKRNDG